MTVTGLSLDRTSLTLYVGETELIVATVTRASAVNQVIEWSSDSSNATVTPDGVVTAESPGSAIITARTQDGGLTASCAVTVTGPLPHTYLDVFPAVLAFQNAINAAIGCGDPAAPAYSEYAATPALILSCYFNGYVNSGYTLNGAVMADILPTYAVGPINGTVLYSGGVVSEILCNAASFNAPRSGSLVIKFTDSCSGTLDLASLAFIQD